MNAIISRKNKQMTQVKVKASIRALVGEWEGHAEEHPLVGQPGITYRAYGDEVECLLFYAQSGELAGIFYYYPRDIFRDSTDPIVKKICESGEPVELAGNFFVIVAPGYQREGIATKLLAEAVKNWPINFEQQKYTPAGASLANKFLNKRKTSKVSS